MANEKANGTPLKPRPPTHEELDELRGYIRKQGGMPEDEMELMLGGSCVAVFDDYITDCPGYAGKVMTAVWSGSPTFFETFIWNDGKMEKAELDDGLSVLPLRAGVASLRREQAHNEKALR